MDETGKAMPGTVEAATLMLGAALVAGLFRTIQRLDLSAIDASPGLIYALLFVGYGLMGLLVYKISSGKNWARILYTAMLLVGMFKTIPALVALAQTSLLNGLISGGLVTLQFVAIALLFHKSSNVWFRQPNP